jgi:polygalacturonase
MFSSALFAQTLATGDQRPNVKEPTYPMVCKVLTADFNTSQRAEDITSAEDDTARIQDAFDSCQGTDKSIVLTATNTENAFFTNKLDLKAGETLVVGPGVTLFGDNSYAKESELIYAKGANIGIMGPGTIDGRGDLLSSIGKPRLIEAKDLSNFVVYNITLKNACKMHLYMEDGSGVTVWKLRVLTPANTKNTDGVDIDSLNDVTVAHSSINAGDDGIVVKTNSAPASDITVKDNQLYGTHGLSIGSQTMYGVTNVLWENNIVFGTDKFGIVSTDNNGINIKSDYACGGEVKQITYRNTQLIGVKHLLIFNTYYGSCSGFEGYPYYHDIVVDGVTAADSQSGAYSEFEGYNADYPLGLYLAHVHLDVTNQTKSQYANVGLDNSNIIPAGTGVTTFYFNVPPPVGLQ